jgi:hypothetical protein
VPKVGVLVHGYSENSLAAYAKFPNALRATAPELEQLVLSAFNSLDDGVTIDDLAYALEKRMQAAEKRPGWDTSQAVFIAHSTGALVTRRWLLNRLHTGDPIPSHLITMAGANHGSSLAQLGRTPLGYAHQYLLKHSLGVGARVLQDLDYGSTFLLRLNRDWLAKRYDDPENGTTADPRMAKLFQFSMGGDFPGNDKAVELLWASSEPGTDNTVRLSGANLNYTYLVADQEKGTLKAVPSKPQAHLIIPGYSHYGDDTGVMASNTKPSDPPMQAIRQALDVTTDEQYKTILDDWSARSKAWCDDPKHVDDANSTILFYLHDSGGSSISQSFIGLLDASVPGLDIGKLHDGSHKSLLVEAMRAVTNSIEPQSPIHNDTQRGSYSFYVNTKKFNELKSHMVTIEASSGSPYVEYGPLHYRVDHGTVEQLVFANQFTYVEVKMPRMSESAYALYDATLVDDTSRTHVWPPFSQGAGLFAPPPEIAGVPGGAPDAPAAAGDAAGAQPSTSEPAAPASDPARRGFFSIIGSLFSRKK